MSNKTSLEQGWGFILSIAHLVEVALEPRPGHSPCPLGLFFLWIFSRNQGYRLEFCVGKFCLFLLCPNKTLFTEASRGQEETTYCLSIF